MRHPFTPVSTASTSSVTVRGASVALSSSELTPPSMFSGGFSLSHVSPWPHVIVQRRGVWGKSPKKADARIFKAKILPALSGQRPGIFNQVVCIPTGFSRLSCRAARRQLSTRASLSANQQQAVFRSPAASGFSAKKKQTSTNLPVILEIDQTAVIHDRVSGRLVSPKHNNGARGY